MKKLIKGLHKFQTEVFPLHKDFFQELTKGQSPETLFITCSDSRINPNLVTSAGPGDLFIVRNAGNIVPPYNIYSSEAATIEFAVSILGIQQIIICGHSHCGMVEAIVDNAPLQNLKSLSSWAHTHIQPTLNLVSKNYPNLAPEALKDILLQEHVLQQIENLKTHPVISAGIANKTLAIHAWIYQFELGDIFSFNVQEGQFERIKHF